MADVSPSVLIVGTGSIGRRHIANLRLIDPRCRFTLLRAGARCDALSEDVGARVVASLEEALADHIDLAVLASPSDRHAAVLLPLLQARVPTFVEKPIVITSDDADAVERLAGAVPTQAGCVLRFLPSLRRLHGWIREGRLGRIVRAGFEVGQYLPDWRPAQDYRTGYSADPQRGGGVVFDLIHEIDLACWLLGDELTLAGAWGARLSHLDIKAEDTATLVLLAPCGTQAAIQLDYVARAPIRRLTIVGDRGTATWSLTARDMTFHDASGLVEHSTEGFDTDGAYVAAMRELVDAARTASPTSLPLAAALPATRLAIAANALIRSNAPVLSKATPC